MLVVEDNDMNQQLTEELLNRAGISTVIANNGQEALDILQGDCAFDGILMDCQMPVMDGYSATKHIRATAPWAHIPVIAMTANAMSDDKALALEVGMKDHIAKPINVDKMFAVMQRWITPAHPSDASVPVTSRFQGSAQAADFPLLKGIDTRAGLQRALNDAEAALINRRNKFLQDARTELAKAIASDLSIYNKEKLHQALKDDQDVETQSVEVDGSEKKVILIRPKRR